MSSGRPVRLADAEPVALELVELLRPDCARIEIAGSVRRQRPMVSDLEIVAMPRTETANAGDLWGGLVEVDLLADRILELRNTGALAARQVSIHRADGSIEQQTRLGADYQALTYRELPVDLFIVREADRWGTIFAIRTGPGDWNQRIVTDCKRYLRRVEGGYVYRAGQRVPCPEERDFFAAVGQPWVEPELREAHRVDIRAVVPA